MNGWQELLSLATVLTLAFGSALCAVWMRRRFAALAMREIQATIRAAIQNGRDLTPETVRAIASGVDAGREDLRRGVILIALALALLAMSAVFPVAIGDSDIPDGFTMLIAGSAAFPGFLGLARLLLHVTRPRLED